MKYSKSLTTLFLANPNAGYLPRREIGRPRTIQKKPYGTIPFMPYASSQPKKSTMVLGTSDHIDGENNDLDAQRAFIDIMDDNMQSLAKSIKEGKVDPDITFFAGNKILHLIALKSKDKSLDEDKYYNVIEQLKKRGANLMAKNNAGHTALDYILFKDESEFATRLRNAHKGLSATPTNQKELNTQLRKLAKQNPSLKEKRRAVELLKSGADTNYHTTRNTKSTLEIMTQNWSPQNSKAFKEVINAYKFMCVLNKKTKVKLKTNSFYEELWSNALKEFYTNDKSLKSGKGL